MAAGGDLRGKQPAYLKFALVGLVAGLTSGLFGVGGGVVIVPMLVGLVGLDQRLAHGTSLTAILPISIAGAVSYGLAGEVAWLPAVPVAVGAVVGAVVGSRLLERLPLATLRMGFAGLLIVSAARMLVSVPEGSGSHPLDLVSGIGYLTLGLFSGILAGTLGVGGGIVLVPGLTIFTGFGLVLAKGTSLAVIIPTALAATMRNQRVGTTAMVPGLLVGATGVVSGFGGARLALVLDATWAAALFAALLLIAAVRLLVQERSRTS